MFLELEKWMRLRLLDKSHPVTDMQIQHLAQEGEVVLDTYRVDAEKDTELQLQEACAQFGESSKAHVNEHTRSQRYAIVMLEGSRIIGQRPFRLHPVANLPDIGETESPNNAGAQAQGMRFVESLHRTYMMQVAVQNEKVISLLDKMIDRNMALETKRAEDVDMRESLLTRQNERDLAMAEVNAKQARMDRVYEQLIPAARAILPDIASKLLSSPKHQTPTEGASEGQTVPIADKFRATVMEFFGSITEEQTDQLMKVLTPEQAAKIFTLMGADKNEA